MTKGIYAIIINISEKLDLNIGKNRNYNFLPGYYIYIGSAFGTHSNNIENRLSRHFSNNKKLFWHIDYLLNCSKIKIIKAFYAKTNLKKECELSAQFFNYSNADLYKNFGNSDCKADCNTHLYYFGNISNLEDITINAFKNINLNPEFFKIK